MVTLTGKHQDQTKNFFHNQILSHVSQYWTLPGKKIAGISQLIKNNMEFSGVIMVGFKVLKFLKGATQFCEVSKGQALSGIFWSKVKTLKIPGEF